MSGGPPITIIGAGGHAKVVHAAIRAAGHEVAAFFDDDRRLWGTKRCGVVVEGPVARLAARDPCPAVIAVGDNRLREAIARQLAMPWMVVAHPRAWVDRSVRLEEGTVVCAGAVVQPDTAIGRHSIINTAASVDHDCRVDDFAHVGPGAHLAGGVHVGTGTLVGIGAVAVPGIRIGAYATVGAGAVVVRDVPAGVVVTGCPAREVRAAARAA